jgi:signal transduction histidine kinase
MMQIFENFLSNAVKYSPEGRSIFVRTVFKQGHVTLEVQDEGPGLSEDDQGKLFQKFVRLTPQPTAGESSNGLGLSIVKRLAESMGASVGCRSRLGQGTIFWITLRGYHNAAAA